jgi:hypothetical protein
MSEVGGKFLPAMAERTLLIRIDQVWCNPTAVAVRFCPGQAGAKFALFSGRSVAGRTTDCKYLFGSEVFFHNREDGDPNRCAGMFNFKQLRKS